MAHENNEDPNKAAEDILKSLRMLEDHQANATFIATEYVDMRLRNVEERLHKYEQIKKGLEELREELKNKRTR